MIRGRGAPRIEVVRSYGAVLVVTVAFLVMAAAVDPAARPQEQVAAGPVAGVLSSIPGAVPGVPGAPVTGTDGSVAGGPTSNGDRVNGGSGAGPAAITGCGDRKLQVPGDPYSPPCIAFSGDNGGATSRGVTADEIVIAVRELEGPTAAEIFADLSGQPVITSKEAVHETLIALAEYFSSRFQFYGRKLKLEFFSGQGNGGSELLGAGQERALADAVHVAKEMKAFADISGITTPYSDALSRQHVLNIGAPYPPQQWFVDRRPYAWSNFPDGTTVVDTIATWARARLLPEPIAKYAGAELKGRKRVYGVVGPENPEYQSSGDRFGDQLGRENIALGITYRLDIASMPNQASNIIAQLKDRGVTTVICACDPVMLALGMAPKANEQSYFPEWVTGGLAFVDQDIVSQLIDPDQWQRSFGLAFNAESEPLGRSFAHAAYRQMRPGSEPAFGVAEAYYQFYLLALGIQLAGPNLTPETYEAGMFSYPGARGFPRHVAIRAWRLHVHRRLPRDLVGRATHLRPERSRGGMERARQRRALHERPSAARHGQVLRVSERSERGLSGPAKPRADELSESHEPLLFRGFAPLVLAIVLAVLMVILVPSVAPERIVREPVTSTTVTTRVR